MATEKPTFFVNAHTHCFTSHHVPEHFTKTLTWLSPFLKISWIREKHLIRWLVFFLSKKWVAGFISTFAPAFARSLPRLLNFAENFDVESQEIMIRELQSYYPAHTKFVVLTMDMEYMAAGLPAKNFEQQLAELAECKRSEKYKDIIYPFVFADPRRPNVTDIVIARLQDKEAPFAGIKIYPALGYYPFDKRLKDVYEYAVKHNLPITTHCIKGAVYYRGKKTDDPTYATHPITNKALPFTEPVDFSANFTHPYNYECLLNEEILRKHWNDNTVNLSDLKICLGHFGGEDEWLKYLEAAWLPDRDFTEAQKDTLDIINNNWYDIEATGDLKEVKAYSWFSIVCELMRKYSNVYADISYTLCEPRILPLLKVLLQSGSSITNRILFGTDYYVVSKAGAEREMSLNVRSYLGEELFQKIACTNPCAFLNISTHTPLAY